MFDYKILKMTNLLRKNPNNKLLLYMLGSRFLDFKDFDKAVNYFNLLYDIDPNYKDVKKKSEESITKYIDETMGEMNINYDPFFSDYDNLWNM